MARFLYSGMDGSGKPIQGFVDADGANEARLALLERGLAEVVIHNDLHSARSEAGQDEPADDAEARLRILFQNDHRLSTFLLEVIRGSKWELLVSTGLLVWALYNSSIWLACLAGAAILVLLGLPLWKLRVARRYDRLIRAQALGRWQDMEPLLDNLEGRMVTPDGEFDLAVRKAEMLVQRGERESAHEVLEPWQAILSELAPSLYLGREASLYWRAGEYDRFLANMREVARLNPDDPVSLLDAAMAELRFGDADAAAHCLEKVDADSLPPFAQPYVAWAHGLLAQRRGQPEAVELLGQAFSAISAHAEQPLHWTGIALVAADYGLAVLDAGDHSRAAKIIRPVWPILQHHGSAPVLKRIRQNFSKTARQG